MKYRVENSYKIIEMKYKFLRTDFLSFFVIYDLRKQKTIKGQIFINLKLKKNRYVKIDTLFSATKAMIPNDANPFGEQPKNPRTHTNK